MWVHKKCDEAIAETQKFKEISLSTKKYFCPFCRDDMKNQLITDFIQIPNRKVLIKESQILI